MTSQIKQPLILLITLITLSISFPLLTVKGKSKTSKGIASKYTNDKGLEKHPDVVVFTDFENDNWKNQWTGGKRDTVTFVDSDKNRKFESLHKKAMRIKVPKGQHYGGSIQYKFKKQTGSEPEEIYFRYYLRFADDWDPARGGKLPGIGGTYRKAGWGGRKSDGSNGWSARGVFQGQKNKAQTSA